MFGKNKNAILHTNLIVKVRKYKNEQPYFSFHNNPAIADETKARLTVEKLNEIAELDKEENWQTQYYSVSLTLQKGEAIMLPQFYITMATESEEL